MAGGGAGRGDALPALERVADALLEPRVHPFHERGDLAQDPRGGITLDGRQQLVDGLAAQLLERVDAEQAKAGVHG